MKTRILLFVSLLLLSGCWDKSDIGALCDDGKPHAMTKWNDVGTGMNALGESAVEQIRHCEKCGRVQVAWHR